MNVKGLQYKLSHIGIHCILQVVLYTEENMLHIWLYWTTSMS